MKKIILTQKELEQKAEKILENACAYHAIGRYKNMMQCYGEYLAIMDIMEDIGVYYDDDCIINEHCHNMLEIIEEAVSNMRVVNYWELQKGESNA